MKEITPDFLANLGEPLKPETQNTITPGEPRKKDTSDTFHILLVV